LGKTCLPEKNECLTISAHRLQIIAAISQVNENMQTDKKEKLKNKTDLILSLKNWEHRLNNINFIVAKMGNKVHGNNYIN
jgi:hypothetical protein